MHGSLTIIKLDILVNNIIKCSRVQWRGLAMMSWANSLIVWVSERLLLNTSSAISWREQANFQWDDEVVHFVLDQLLIGNFYSASLLKQQSAGRHVAPLWHIILIPSQPTSLLFLLNAAYLAENQQIPIL